MDGEKLPSAIPNRVHRLASPRAVGCNDQGKVGKIDGRGGSGLLGEAPNRPRWLCGHVSNAKSFGGPVDQLLSVPDRNRASLNRFNCRRSVSGDQLSLRLVDQHGVLPLPLDFGIVHRLAEFVDQRRDESNARSVDLFRRRQRGCDQQKVGVAGCVTKVDRPAQILADFLAAGFTNPFALEFQLALKRDAVKRFWCCKRKRIDSCLLDLPVQSEGVVKKRVVDADDHDRVGFQVRCRLDRFKFNQAGFVLCRAECVLQIVALTAAQIGGHLVGTDCFESSHAGLSRAVASVNPDGCPRCLR